jgi:hypothetical protein
VQVCATRPRDGTDITGGQFYNAIFKGFWDKQP